MDFLEEILGEDLFKQVSEKINAHNGDEANKEKQIKIANLGGGEYVAKGKHEAELEKIQNLLNGKTTELDTANGVIAELKKSAKSDEALQAKITAYETEIAQLQAQMMQTQLEAEIKVALLEAKATDIPYMTFKLQEKGEKLELGEDGKIKGIDDLISGLKVQFPAHFEAANRLKVEPNPLPGRTEPVIGITPEQFSKMGYQSRLKLKQEQPEVYAQMTGKSNE